MIPSVQISLSGLQAAEKRLAVSANNIANASTPNYVPQEVVQTSQAEGGVSSYVRSETADAEEGSDSGSSSFSHVNLEDEVVNQITAVYDFKANLKVLQRIDEMSKKLVDVIS